MAARQKINRLGVSLACWLSLSAPLACCAAPCETRVSALDQRTDWAVYGGHASGDHYSPLKQINRRNVHRLQLAWKFDAAEAGGLETSPIIVGQTLYAYTAWQTVIALDAATGKRLWTFDSGTHNTQPPGAWLIGPTESKRAFSPALPTICMRSTRPRGNLSPSLGSKAKSICARGCGATTSRNPLI